MKKLSSTTRTPCSRVPLDHGHSRRSDGRSHALRGSTAPRRAQALSARAHARAAVPLQPRLHRLRENPVPGSLLKQHLTVEQCLAASDECGAPVVSIAGGEPLLHPQIAEIVGGLVDARPLRLPVHERAAARGEARRLQARSVTSASASTWTARATSTIGRSAARASTTRRSTPSARRCGAASA